MESNINTVLTDDEDYWREEIGQITIDSDAFEYAVNGFKNFQNFAAVKLICLHSADGSVTGMIHQGKGTVKLYKIILVMKRRYYAPYLQLTAMPCSKLENQSITVKLKNWKCLLYDRRAYNKLLRLIKGKAKNRMFWSWRKEPNKSAQKGIT